MRRFILRLLIVSLLSLGALSRGQLTATASGCTPAPGAAITITCTLDVGCPGGYTNRSGSATFVGLSTNPMYPPSATRILCTQLDPPETPDSTSSSSPSDTTAPASDPSGPSVSQPSESVPANAGFVAAP